MSIVFLIDISGSMFGRAFEQALQAIDVFFRQHLGPQDEVTGCVFSDEVACGRRWTRDAEALLRELRVMKPGGGTYLYEAIDHGLALLETATHTKRALVILSDGRTYTKRRTHDDAERALRRAESLTYAVAVRPTGVPLASVVPGPVKPGPADFFKQSNDDANVSLLRSLTDKTGGRTIAVWSETDIPATIEEIANELGRQYQLGYVMPRQPDGKYHDIKVTTRTKRQQVRARGGYLARLK